MEEERYIEIVTTYSPMVYRVALHDCRNHADAEDIMQNVLLRLYRFGPRFDSEEHLRRWLIQVTVRESRRLFAKPFRKREELFEEIDPNVMAAGRREETSDSGADGTILADVFCLPRKYRVVIYLYYYEEYSVREIADILGKKESTVQTELWRARQKLKQKWKGETKHETAGKKAVNEVIQMKPVRQARRRLMHKKAVALAAACMGIFACSIVGTAAARHFQVEFFVDGKVLQIGATMEQDSDGYVIHMDEKEQGQRDMTLAELLGISVVHHADKNTVGLVLGEEERDITEELRTHGSYQTAWEQDGKTYVIRVTGGETSPAVTVTEQ